MDENIGAKPPIKRFECNGCGKCCRNFGKDGFLPLWEWEVEEYEKLASEKGVMLQIEPEAVIHDRKSGLLFCLKYGMRFGMNNQPCLFLNENRCSIYENRSLACRVFPMAKTPYETHRIDDTNFGTCPALNVEKFFQAVGATREKGIKIKSQETARLFREFFVDNYDYCEQNEVITAVVKRTLSSLVYQKKVQPEEAQQPYDKQTQIYSFFEFLVKIGVCTNEEKIETVNTLKDHKLFFQMMKEREGLLSKD